MSILWVINGILLVIVLAMVFNELYLKITVKRSAKMLTEEEFKETMRKAQVIDVREKDTFDAGHILGARSMPYSMLKTTIGSLRKDQPVYLYDQKKALSIRAANLLRKNGYTDIYILKGGYDGWTGKVKKRNS
ncbi:TPA: rhodanese-like domain-containing protein [Enterococcus faecalis]|uniref:rhodanese-like domain-containing protein n=1 Tax=Enterococcus faecalis TaxID=1351 RepID=UPI0011420340|nr:rhodanese-like domain-containing protein [Enterococcus faecalis]EGO8342627.1 rhodanese-like domain-containing protein [Enterococcus faecalis]EGO8776098.1 rhodanese-like domain-containing protein [Enterococcus faecalis]EHL2446593.1 rhodanese-like domain-containing protein [Enterococcus faecalis]EKF8848596.1 rhodanese-like domain-containing protein [Enterococcus faecalis]NSV87801.1 rhodanese-like domain-containing protein [Enterococcus faecalis]